jgi:hypothetical protein
MFALRQGLRWPVGHHPDRPGAALPDTLRPAMAGAVAANGGTTLQHAMATIFSLAERGVVTITEEPRRWGERHFTLQRCRGAHRLAPEEDAALTLAFRRKGVDVDEDAVACTKVRTRLAARLGPERLHLFQLADATLERRRSRPGRRAVEIQEESSNQKIHPGSVHSRSPAMTAVSSSSSPRAEPVQTARPEVAEPAAPQVEAGPGPGSCLAFLEFLMRTQRA